MRIKNNEHCEGKERYETQEDSRTNPKEMKEMLGYMSRHHEGLEKSFSDEQRELFEKFHDCWSEYMSLAEASIFEYAFKLGMQIAIETLTDNNINLGIGEISDAILFGAYQGKRKETP